MKEDLFISHYLSVEIITAILMALCNVIRLYWIQQFPLFPFTKKQTMISTPYPQCLPQYSKIVKSSFSFSFLFVQRIEIIQIIIIINQKMIWFPYYQQVNDINTYPQLQYVELATNGSSQETSRNYPQLQQYCNQLERENQQLKNQLKALKEKISRKRVRLIKRRTQNQLVKNFKCLYTNCKKQYASELALNLHMRNKHNAGCKRDRIALVNKILKADQKGISYPETSINLPPNYIENLRTEQQKLKEKDRQMGDSKKIEVKKGKKLIRKHSLKERSRKMSNQKFNDDEYAESQSFQVGENGIYQ